uniref:Structural polyprotein n=1 Tax=Renmark bee virus 3 TaxID=2201309 RepID=A0A2U8JQ94_9VIRU|nr:structural polyprotein [Renmark bee virus 3]
MPGQYVQFKRMLLQRLHQTRITVQSLTVDEQLALLEELEQALQRNNRGGGHADYEIQSSDVVESFMASDQAPCIEEQDSNVIFDDTEILDDIIYGAPTDPSFFSTDDDVSSISKFLGRQVQIFTTSWSEGGFSLQTFDPWTLFLSDTRVKKKIDNFMYLNCKLKLEFRINCSPFLYGGMRVSYRPFLLTPDNLLANSTVGLSQRPGFWIFPQDNATYKMDLPFFWHRDNVYLTSAAEIANLGSITLKEVSQLISANGAISSGVTISVFAHAEDVHLSAPTTALALQSKDEYGNGPISAPATALAKAMGYFTRIPIIGPYAKATEIGANATSAIARIFGFTNVPIIDDVKPLKNMPFGHMCSAHGSEPVTKLTLDPKAELTIDSRTAGLDGKDEMTLPSIVMRESYFTQFNWTTADATDTLKLNCGVNPSYWVATAGTQITTYQFTPMGHVGEMFNNWRGDIEFRFKVIASKFHRGRLRFTWDPIGPLATTTGSSSTNVAYTKIVDIGENTEVAIRVPYMQARQFLQTRSASTNTINPFQTTGFSNYTSGTTIPTVFNGQLTVRVMTALSAPIDTSSVTVLCFVRGCENFEFANPRSLDDAFTYYSVQSADVIVPVDSTNSKSNLLCYGESFNSLRTVLRRHQLLDSYNLRDGDVTSVIRLVNISFKKFPYSPGFTSARPTTTQARGLITTGTLFDYAYCHMTPLAWMAGAYLGKRGAIRQAFFYDSDSTVRPRSVRIYRSLNTLTNGGAINSNSSTAGSTQAQMQSLYQSIEGSSGFEASVQFDNAIQSGITVECPQYTGCRFEICDPTNPMVGSSEDDTDRETYNLETQFSGASTQTRGAIRRYVAIGTDFTFLFYLNAPTMRKNSKNPGTVTSV